MKILKARPSGLEKVMGCAGSLEAEDHFPPDPMNKYMARGIRLHEGMALAFRIGFKAAVEKVQAAWAAGYEQQLLGYHTGWESDLKQLTDAHAAGLLVIPHGANLAIEHALDLEQLGLTGGRPDLMAVAGDQGAVIDWKFGSGLVPDPAVNPQLWIYAAALVSMKPELTSVSLSIVQPGTWKVDQAHREHTFTPVELAAKVKEVKAQLALANTPNAPLTAGDHCGFCRAKNACDTYKAAQAGQVQQKVEAKAEAMAVVTEGTPVEVRFAPALPDLVVVVSKELVAKANDILARVRMLKVTDQGTANTMGLIAKEGRGLLRMTDDIRKLVKEPYLQACRDIDEAPAEVVKALSEAVNMATNAVTQFLQAEEAKANVAAAEQKRRDEEAAKARAAAEEAVAKAAADKAAAEAAAQAEAEARAAAPAPEPQQDLLSAEGAVLLSPPSAVAATVNAEAARRAAEASEAEARAALAKANETALSADLAPQAGTPAKVAGFRGTEQVTYEFPDLTKVPAEWVKQLLVPDDRVVKALLKSGKLTEKVCEGWMTITRKTVAAGSR